MLKIGDIAPDFQALDQNDQTHQLKDYQGKWLLLYFYPRDNTPGCTKEACVLRDNFADFKKLGAKVLGVSVNSASSHQKFATKFQLPFDLLADTEKKIIKAYQAGGLFSRISYLIDPQGKIAKTYPKVKPEKHAEEVLADLKDLINK